MCASGRIPACERHGEVVVTLLVRDEISIAQEGAEVVVARNQLTDVAERVEYVRPARVLADPLADATPRALSW